jgi:predicted enzyme related to lactoylglutathione lyase
MRKLDFVSIQVKDLEVSKDFYVNQLEFDVSAMSNPEACIFSFNKGEASFAIRKPIGNIDGKELGVGVSLWFAIDEEIEELEASLTRKQVTLLGPITTTPFGKTLVAKDPDGYSITFLKSN